LKKSFNTNLKGIKFRELRRFWTNLRNFQIMLIREIKLLFFFQNPIDSELDYEDDDGNTLREEIFAGI